MNRKEKIRVCLVGPSLDILGGQAIQLQRLFLRLAANPELRVTFLAVNPRLPGMLRCLQGVKYVRTVVTSIAYGLSLLWRIPRVDVVHAFSASYWSFLLAPVPAMLTGRLFRRAVILNYRSGEAEDHFAHWRSAGILTRLAEVIVVPSGYLVDVFKRHGFEAVAISNFVDIERYIYRERHKLKPVFLSNRNFEEHYNVSCVLRAFRRIEAAIPNAKLILAGDGPLRGRLQEEALRLGLRNVDFRGAVAPDRMPVLYDEADVYLNAPSIDNMPNSILEAAACGLPIVTTNAGGIRYIVRQGETALMVPCDNEVALAAEALRLFEESGLAQRLASAARSEVICQYRWESVEASWIEVYRQARAAK